MKRSHLPPLQPTESSKLIESLGYTDLSLKLTLIERARSTVAAHDLNQIIRQLSDLFQHDVEATSVMGDTNSIKHAELVQAEKQLSQIQTKLNNLKANSEIIKCLNPTHLLERNEQLKQSILENEKMRQTLNSPILARDIPQIISKSESTELKYLHLTDLNFIILESLVYTLQKRVLNVDASQHSFAAISQEFGTIADLVAAAERLKDENGKLKEQEKPFHHDAFLKRIPLGKLTLTPVRSLSLIFSRYIHSKVKYMELLSFPFDSSGADFVALSKDAGFSIPPDDLIAEDQINDVIEQNRKTIEAIQATNVVPHEYVDSPQNPLEKVIFENTEHFNRITALDQKIALLNRECGALTSQIHQAINEIDLYARQGVLIKSKYNSLRISEEKVMFQRSTIQSVSNSLTSLSLAFGKNRVEKSTELGQYLIKHKPYYPTSTKKSFNISTIVDKPLSLNPTETLASLEIALNAGFIADGREYKSQLPNLIRQISSELHKEIELSLKEEENDIHTAIETIGIPERDILMKQHSTQRTQTDLYSREVKEVQVL